jgi:hypothetical protein
MYVKGERGSAFGDRGATGSSPQSPVPSPQSPVPYPLRPPHHCATRYTSPVPPSSSTEAAIHRWV